MMKVSLIISSAKFCQFLFIIDKAVTKCVRLRFQGNISRNDASTRILASTCLGIGKEQLFMFKIGIRGT